MYLLSNFLKFCKKILDAKDHFKNKKKTIVSYIIKNKMRKIYSFKINLWIQSIFSIYVIISESKIF